MYIVEYFGHVYGVCDNLESAEYLVEDIMENFGTEKDDVVIKFEEN